MKREGTISIEKVTVNEVEFEIVLDDIGYFVKRGGNVVRGFKQKPTETDLEKL